MSIFFLSIIIYVIFVIMTDSDIKDVTGYGMKVFNDYKICYRINKIKVVVSLSLFLALVRLVTV